MSWVREIKYKWYERFALNVIKVGPLPRHVAFIMDGNRRFARSTGINKIEGHTKGFDKLSECLQWCLEVGIQEVTTFAFSIENFKRSDDEVSALLDLAKKKFEKLLEEEEKLRENGVCIRIIGNLSLLPMDLQQAVAKAMLLTENNNKLFLNIAFAYTSHEEMTNSFLTVIEGSNNLEPEDISEELVRQCLYTKSPGPDLLIRTSGESRISDFLMWQISATVLYFTKALWPVLTLWHFLYGIFSYQRSYLNMSVFKLQHQRAEAKVVERLPERVQNFLRKVEARRHDHLVNLANAKLKSK